MIFQSDIAQHNGIAKQLRDYRKETGKETYWTDTAFGGMPTYQLGAKYPHNYIKKLDLALRFLPRPADYLFLYFIGMYILFLVLKVDYKLAFLGALAFGFSTYLIIILGVGHNAKAHAIAYMPLVLSGIVLTFRGKYFYGFLLTAVAMALELVSNHFQMTYYLLLLVLCLGVAYLIDAFRKNMLPHFGKAILVLLAAVIVSIGLNATNILATKEYADASTRGKSELTINPDGSPKEATNGLEYDYITEYSYGKLESFNLFIPRFMGGGSGDPLPDDSKAFDELLKLGASPQEAGEIVSQLPVYWGDQPIVAAPAYLGAVIIFLAVLGLFLVRGRLKWWVTGAFVLSLLLSWGKNFDFLTDFFINYVPLYNKFRAVSSIQVIIELVVPVIAIVGLQQWFNAFERDEEKKKALLYSLGIVGGLSVLFILFKSTLFSFSSPYDVMIREQLGTPLVDALRDDRASLFTSDTLRSLAFVLGTAGALWFFLKNKISEKITFALLAGLIVCDLVLVDRRYVNNEDFVQARTMEQPFQKTKADAQILKDDGNYRVYDVTVNPFNSGRASYYHNALGGYHAAKPRRIQELSDFYLSKGDPGILNMMNVKYIITENKEYESVVQENPYANGSAWFIQNVILAEDANQEMLLLDSLDTKTTAVIHKDFIAEIPTNKVTRDSTASIDLVRHEPQHIVYETASTTEQIAVFSEVYYPEGWNVYINDTPATYFRANYVLRAMRIPSGNNKIEFKFEPTVIQTGSTISLASSIVFLLIFGGGLWYYFRKKEQPTNS
ncbi:membrane protein [Ulvibacter litoralis]|nr:membrane protein [Ulvibacter litoralis]